MSSSSELLEESETRFAALPSELEMCIRSWLPIIDHSEFDDCSGGPYSPGLLPGMFIARPPIVGEESGDDSARIE